MLVEHRQRQLAKLIRSTHGFWPASEYPLYQNE